MCRTFEVPKLKSLESPIISSLRIQKNEKEEKDRKRYNKNRHKL